MFGSDTQVYELLLSQAIEHGPVSSSWEIAYCMRMFYDRIFRLSDSSFLSEEGVFKRKNFERDTNPLRLVSMTSKEGLFERFSWHSRFVEYRIYEIEKATGMSFEQWLRLPTYVIDEMLNTLKIETIRREQELQRQSKSFEEQQRQVAIDELSKKTFFK